MNAFGVFTVIVLLFVIYKFLSMVYDMADRKYREGYENTTAHTEDTASHSYY